LGRKIWRHNSINSTRLQPFPTPRAQPANAELQCCKVQASEACRFSVEALASCSGFSLARIIHAHVSSVTSQSGEASDMMLTGSVPARRRFELIRRVLDLLVVGGC